MFSFRKVKFSHKLLLSFLGILFLTLILLFVFVYQSIKTYEYEGKENRLTTVSEVIAVNVNSAIEFDDATEANRVLESLKVVSTVKFVAIIKEDEVFTEYSPSNSTIHFGNFSKIDLEAEGYLLRKQPIVGVSGEVLAELIVLDCYSDVKKLLKEQVSKLIIIFIIVTLFAILLILLALGWMQKPLKKIAGVMEKIADDGDYSKRALAFSNDSIGQLVEVFNKMLEQIETTNEGLKTQKSVAQERVKEVEEAHRQLQEEVEGRLKAEALSQAKSDFLANMSHELRTPLNSMLGFAQLSENKVTDEVVLHHLDSIRNSGSYLLNIINDVLDMSKLESGKMVLEEKEIQLNSFFEVIENIFKAQFERKGLALVFDYPADGFNCVYRFDDTRMRQILSNLLSNALKFTEKGQVKVLVGLSELSGSGTRSFKMIVSDTGQGVPDNQKGKVFQAFEQKQGQSQNQFGGTGLGLSICRHIVNLMGGEIALKDSPEGGAQFEVTIENFVQASCGKAQKNYESEFDLTWSEVENQNVTVLRLDDTDSQIVFSKPLLVTLQKHSQSISNILDEMTINDIGEFVALLEEELASSFDSELEKFIKRLKFLYETINLDAIIQLLEKVKAKID